MSTTVQALPTLLLFAISDEIIKGIADLKNTTSTTPSDIQLECEDIEEFINKEFDTTIVDGETLIKTLDEHGATNIIESNGDISCECESFHLDFYKNNENEAYQVRVTYAQEDGIQELMTNLASEYTTNAQEISYNKIKERLEAQNLYIEEEEIYEDNTIVLTVNLE